MFPLLYFAMKKVEILILRSHLDSADQRNGKFHSTPLMQNLHLDNFGYEFIREITHKNLYFSQIKH